MRRIEVEHYSPEQVRDNLIDALNLVTELDPPTDLRPAVFRRASEMLGAKIVHAEMVQSGPIALPGGIPH